MAKTKTSERDEQYELTRRKLIKWSIATGAALGVSQSKIFEVLEGTNGKGVAFAAADQPTNFLFSMIGGNGGGAHFQNMWPQVPIAEARNPNFAFAKTGMDRRIAGTKNPLVVGPDTPWADLPPQRQVTVFTAGTNQTHTNNPNSVRDLNNNGIYALATTLQKSATSTIPAVSIGGAQYGAAPDAATISNVTNADGVTNLFNSVASRMGTGLLANEGNAQLYKAHYDAFIQLQRASNRATTKNGYLTAQTAASVLGRNLSQRLTVTAADLTRYGVNAGTRASIRNVAQSMAVAVKAFALNLTRTIVTPFMLDDPHGLFDSGDFNTVPGQLKTVFDAFMADLENTIDEVSGKPLSNNIVITGTADTVKDCRNRSGWPDGSPGNTNHIYVYSSGALYSGWWGSVSAAGAVTGYDANGRPAPYNGANTAKAALASIAYAVAKQDERLITNIVAGQPVSGIFGVPKLT